MILFSGHKPFYHQGEEYEFTGEISVDAEGYCEHDGTVNRIDWDEVRDCKKLIEVGFFTSSELVDCLELDISDFLEDQKHVEFNHNE